MKINWNTIDTVLLDMDGTLLDLHFDNFFWLTHLPRRYAEHHGLCADKAIPALHKRFNEKQGTLEWYCLEYWSRELSLNIRQLKEEIDYLITERPFVQEFLEQLGARGKQRILITNAHPHSLDLKLKLTSIEPLLDHVYSSHEFGQPKECPEFWQSLERRQHFNPTRTLFIDDSIAVLNAAAAYGIRHLLAISQPDSKAAPIAIREFPSISHFDEILPNG